MVEHEWLPDHHVDPRDLVDASEATHFVQAFTQGLLRHGRRHCADALLQSL